MPKNLIFILIAVVTDGVAGLAGGVLPTEFVHRHLASLLAFAAGTLIGVAFLDLLPEAFHQGPIEPLLMATLAGFSIFYIIESILGSHAMGQSGHKHTSIGPLILVGDAVHNVTDGIAIAAAFLTDTSTGIATSIAVIVHELPQEIGDYSILIANGYSRPRALMALVIVQFSALLGAILTVLTSQWAHNSVGYLNALSAGGFLYIAAADLMPELHRHRSDTPARTKILSFFFGLAIIALIVNIK